MEDGMDRATNFVFVALLMASAGLAQDAQKPASAAPDASKTSATQTSASPSSAPPVEEYKIGAQDVLRIDVWKEAELTRTVPVRPDGKISLPLLNDVQA